MAIATVTQTPYGYSITGDTDATTVSTDELWIKAISFSGNADNATAALTSLANVLATPTATSCGKFKSSDTGELNSASGNFMWFGEGGSPFKGLAVTLSNAGDHVYIYLAFK